MKSGSRSRTNGSRSIAPDVRSEGRNDHVRKSRPASCCRHHFTGGSVQVPGRRRTRSFQRPERGIVKEWWVPKRTSLSLLEKRLTNNHSRLLRTTRIFARCYLAPHILEAIPAIVKPILHEHSAETCISPFAPWTSQSCRVETVEDQ